MRNYLNWIKENLQRFFLNFNVRITRSSSYDDIDDFINIIRPFKTEHKLIRVGPRGDGGYLLPDDLDGIRAVFSPGVSNIIGFEEDFIKRGIICFLSDYSVENPFNEQSLVHFTKKHISYKNSNKTIIIDDWVNWAETNVLKSNDRIGDYILQMDIEGHEYLSLLSTSYDTISKFRVIIIEFHSLDSLTDPFGFDIIYSTIEKLINTHTIVHIHPNNCRRDVVFKGRVINPLLEVTFLRKDRHNLTSKIESLPHKLDFDNVYNGYQVSLDSEIFNNS